MCFSCLLEIGSQSGRGFILGKQTWWFLLDGSLKPLQTCIISTQKGKSPPQGSVTKPADAVQRSFICPFHLWEKQLFRLYYHSNTTISHSFLFLFRNPLLAPPSPPSHLFFNQAHQLFLLLLACAGVPDMDYKSSLFLLEEGMLKIARYKGNQS